MGIGIGIGAGGKQTLKTKGIRHGSCIIVYYHLKNKLQSEDTMSMLRGRKGLPILWLLSGKPLMCQISLHVHVKAKQEYHSQAYAIRVNGEVTQLLVGDKNRKLLWVDTENLEVVEEERILSDKRER